MSAHHALARLSPAIPVFAAAGFAFGSAYFASLRRGLRICVAGRAWSSYVLLALVRILAAALFLAFAVRWGLPSLLAAFAGFLIARHLAVRAARGPA